MAKGEAINRTMGPIYFIIPAGGVGSRMESDIPKQYLPLEGRAVLYHTLDTFLASEKICKGYVGIAKDDQYYAYPNHPRLVRTLGGSTRAETVFVALQHLKATLKESQRQTAWVLVHDAARPGLSVTELDQFMMAVMSDHDEAGGIMALPAQDTIKHVDRNHRIDQTLNRDEIWLAQTPQMMPFITLFNAFEKAWAAGINVTDEASVLEYNDLFPKVYRGYTHNFKITYPDDLALMRLHFRAKAAERE